MEALSTPRRAVRPAAPLLLAAVLAACLAPTAAGAHEDQGAREHYRKGLRLYRAGDWPAAARAFREAAKRSTAPGDAYYNLACTLALDARRGEALDALQAAIDHGYDDAEHMEEDEDLESLHGDARFEALLRDAQALELPPVNPGSRSGRFWRRSGALRESREAVDRLGAYLAAHPRSGRAAFGLGIAHLNLSDHEASAQAFTRAYELGYRPATTLYNLACVEARRERLDAAFAYLDRAIEAGFDAAGYLRRDDDLDNLRGDPRYRAALRKARAQERDDDRWDGWLED